MRRESKLSAAGLRRWPWMVWRLPAGWTLGTETWLWSLAVHLTAAIVAALVIHSAAPAVPSAFPQPAVTITASFGTALATQRFSLPASAVESEERTLASVGTSLATIPLTIPPE